MRVVLDARPLSTPYENRGVGYLVKNLVRGLPAAAPEIHFVFFLGGEPARFYLPRLPNVESVIVNRRWHRAWAEDFFKLPGEIRRAKADVFHCPVALGPLREINLPLFSPVPLIATIHDLHVETLDDPHMEAYRTEWRYKLQRRAVRRARIVTVSNYTKSLLAGRGITGRGPVEVIPNCVGEMEAAVGFKENTVLFVGDAPHKNASLAASVFRTLADRLPDWNFVMVGRRGKLLPEGGLYMEQLLAENRLRIVEGADDAGMETLFRQSAILFMPSLSEGFGVPALQALSKGACAVVSERGGLPEACGEAGVYVNPEDEAEMVSTLEGLMRNPSLREVLLKKGAAHVEKLLWKDHLQRWVDLYRHESGNA